MKGDDTKFFGSQQYEMNTKFGSYLQSTTCISLFCIPSNIESSESCFAQYLSLFELLSQKSWSRRLKKTSQRTFQSSELTTDLALYSVSKIDFKTSKSETVKSNYECLHNVKHTYLRWTWLAVDKREIKAVGLWRQASYGNITTVWST